MAKKTNQQAEPSGLPLSSLASVPCTPETREALAGAGLFYCPEMTELTAQSLLALHGIADSAGAADKPPCFGRQFDPESTLCAGCLVNPQCWPTDRIYLAKLKRGETSAPAGVPVEAVDRRLVAFKNAKLPRPPVRRAK